MIAGTVLLEHTYDIMDSNGWLRAATSNYYDLQFEMCHVWFVCVQWFYYNGTGNYIFSSAKSGLLYGKNACCPLRNRSIFVV